MGTRSVQHSVTQGATYRSANDKTSRRFYKPSNNSPLYRDQLSVTIKTTMEKKLEKKTEQQLITTIIFKTNQKVSSCFLNITVPALFDYEFDTRQLQQVS